MSIHCHAHQKHTRSVWNMDATIFWTQGDSPYVVHIRRAPLCTKCKYMDISRKRLPSQPNCIPLTVDKLPMEQVHSYRYLDVWLITSLSWSMQAESVCQNARWQIGRKLYSHSNSSTLLQVYLAHVWPHLVYACSASLGLVPTWTHWLTCKSTNVCVEGLHREVTMTAFWTVNCPHWSAEGTA